MKSLWLLLLCSPACLLAAPIKANIAGMKSGPVSVSATESTLQVRWTDATSHQWQATFSLENTKPLITSISADGKTIVENAKPVYRIATGKRTGGWDVFFDQPAADSGGTRRFMQEFHPTEMTATTIGDRVEISFNGMQLGIFSGTLQYDFYPGSAFIQQVAVLSTKESDTAYYYDAGLQMLATADRRPGNNMSTTIVYDDPSNTLQTISSPYGSERHTFQVKYRALAARSGSGSIVAFPSPHRYLFARDYSTNLGYSWYSAWRGQVGLGIQQPADDNTLIYPWVNAPPETQQEMGIFFLLSPDTPAQALEQVKSYTHSDRYPHVDGFVTFAPHWHFAYTEQQIANGPTWEPPFKSVLKNMGVDSVAIMDFHGDGHPSDLTGIRLREIDQYYKACRSQSDKNFLLIPAEEADVILGGHWALIFPKPVYWFMDRKPGQPFKTEDPAYGTVYRVHDPAEIWKMITEQNGFVYQTHPRTKGSTGYPDKILTTGYFKSPGYHGTGWKAMPSDLSSPRLGERAFKTLDDLNNLGLHKITIGEVDLFQIAGTDELYAHMNVNYLPMKNLPDFDQYGTLLNTLAEGQGFISTGEITLPSTTITPTGASGIQVTADINSTFPLRLAEIVWGDGQETHRQLIDLQTTREFDHHQYKWHVDAPGWTWARFAVWDIAGDGAFTNPTWHTP